MSRFLGFVLEALAAVFSHTKAAESVLTKNYEEHVNALLQYFELDFGDDRDRQTEFFKQDRFQLIVGIQSRQQLTAYAITIQCLTSNLLLNFLG